MVNALPPLVSSCRYKIKGGGFRENLKQAQKTKVLTEPRLELVEDVDYAASDCSLSETVVGMNMLLSDLGAELSDLHPILMFTSSSTLIATLWRNIWDLVPEKSALAISNKVETLFNGIKGLNSVHDCFSYVFKGLELPLTGRVAQCILRNDMMNGIAEELMPQSVVDGTELFANMPRLRVAWMRFALLCILCPQNFKEVKSHMKDQKAEYQVVQNEEVNVIHILCFLHMSFILLTCTSRYSPGSPPSLLEDHISILGLHSPILIKVKYTPTLGSYLSSFVSTSLETYYLDGLIETEPLERVPHVLRPVTEFSCQSNAASRPQSKPGENPFQKAALYIGGSISRSRRPLSEVQSFNSINRDGVDNKTVDNADGNHIPENVDEKVAGDTIKVQTSIPCPAEMEIGTEKSIPPKTNERRPEIYEQTTDNRRHEMSDHNTENSRPEISDQTYETRRPEMRDQSVEKSQPEMSDDVNGVDRRGQYNCSQKQALDCTPIPTKGKEDIDSVPRDLYSSCVNSPVTNLLKQNHCASPTRYTGANIEESHVETCTPVGFCGNEDFRDAYKTPMSTNKPINQRQIISVMEDVADSVRELVDLFESGEEDQ